MPTTGGKKQVRVAPSLMCADFLQLGRQLEVMEHKKVDLLHVDIMDGHYVPNFAMSPEFCRQLAAGCRIPLDIHLMIENPEAHLREFAGLPGATVSFHPEVSRQPLRVIELIHAGGAGAGIVLDPALPVQSVRHLLASVDQVCVLTVNPGYAGQKLIPRALEKIPELARLLAEEGSPAAIEVDGNVSWNNIPGMIQRGAQVLVLGSSSVFEKGGDLARNLDRLYGLIGRG
jgi:ribulose-phosphate 3-epimerase